MKIVFEKLQTSSENVYVDFGDGVWKPYPVNEAKANGIIIPYTCKDYSKIRIKGSTEVLPNMDVITGIKRYEKVGVDEITYYVHLEGHSITDDNGEIPNYNANFYVYNNHSNEYYPIEDIPCSIISEGDYIIDLGSAGKVIPLTTLEGEILSELKYDNEYQVSEGSAIYIGTSNPTPEEAGEGKLTLGSSDFKFGHLYFDYNKDTGTCTLDKTSPAIQDIFTSLGSDLYVRQLDSSDGDLGILPIETTDIGSSNSVDVYSTIDGILDSNLYLFTNVGSGYYKKTNLKISFS